MKNLLTTLLLILTITSYGQTKLDSLIFDMVNEYRVSNGLTAWVWDDNTFLIAEKHNEYQVKISDISHKELQDVEDHKEVSRLAHRFDVVFTNWMRCGENIAVVNTLDLSVEEIAATTLEMWIASPPHNRTLLQPTKYEYGAISSHSSTKWSRSKYAHSNSWVYVTLNVYGGSLPN